MKFKRAVFILTTLLVICIPILFFTHAYASGADFVLTASNPVNGQTVKLPDLLDNGIYLKFNNPVDRDYERYVSVVFRGEGGFRCQWNICGWVEYAENDTRIIWHPSESFINSYLLPGNHLEIGIGITDLGISYKLKDLTGNGLEVTRIEFSIDACQPSVGVQVNGDPHGICYFNEFASNTFIQGDTFNVTFSLNNPACGQEIILEGKAWVKLPDESLISLTTSDTIFQMNPGDAFSINSVQYTFSGQETAGLYEIGLRIMDPINGSHYSTATSMFSFDGWGGCQWAP